MANSKRQFIPFHGVIYLPTGSRGWKAMKHPWSARVVRLGKAWNCGAFDVPEDAARAYDNASFYTSRWSKSGQPKLNFPAEYRDQDTRPRPTEKTLSIISRLKMLQPEDTSTPNVSRESDLPLIEGTLFKLSQSLSGDSQLLTKTWLALVSKCRYLETRCIQREQEIAMLKLALDGAKSSVSMTRILQTPGTPDRVVSEAEAIMDEEPDGSEEA